MAGALAYVVWFLCVSLLGNVKPVESSHFMGGIIQWRPVNPAAFDGLVQISHRVAWKRDSFQGSGCSQATIDTQTLLPSGGQMTCQSGCSGVIGESSYYCTDFSTIDTWSAGEQTYVYNFTESSFEAVFANSDWISLIRGGGSWNLRIRGNLTYRKDTGLINSSPVVNMPPLIRLQHRCSHTIKIPTVDVDGDYIRCRWAQSSLRECGGVCSAFSVNLNERACEIHYNGSNVAAGDYAVALQIEDFMSPTDTAPLSSVPVQFVVRVQAFAFSPCTSKPEFVGVTPLNGSYFEVPLHTSWDATIITRVSDSSTATSITEIITASPLGMIKSNLIQFGNPGEWQMNVTWTPIESQFGPNIFCFAAIDNIGLQSAQRCVTLLAFTEPPMILPDSLFPRGKIFSNQSLWLMSVQFDKRFTRPTRDKYIRIFGEEGDEVLSINVKSSPAVTYPSDALGRILTFDVNICQLPVNQTFYVLLDAGVAVGTEFCHAESPPMTDPTLWTFVLTEPMDTQELEMPDIDTTFSSMVIEESTIITTVCACTVLAFILGIICGLIAYHCVSSLLKKRKLKADHEHQGTAASLNIKKYVKRVHYKMNAKREPSDVYDNVTPHYCEPGIPNIQMKLNENVAYGQV